MILMGGVLLWLLKGLVLYQELSSSLPASASDRIPDRPLHIETQIVESSVVMECKV